MPNIVRASVLALIIASACAGSLARQNTLLPAIAQTWSHLRVESLRQLDRSPDAASSAAVRDADSAVQSGSAVAFAAVQWALIDQLVANDIATRVATGEIGPGVAESLLGRLKDFAEARSTYVGSMR